MEIENKGNPEADELIKKALILIEDAEIEIERGGNPTLSEALGLIFEAQWVEGISLAQKKESADIDGYIHWLRREYPLADL